MPGDRPVHVLHVVGGMDRGGVETWLVQVLRHMDPSRVRMDFLVHTDRACAYDEEIQALGARILRCPRHRNFASYARRFWRVLTDHGPFDVVHSHVHHFSGFVLWLARRAGIPMRIAHSHSDTSHPDSTTGLFRRLYMHGCCQLISMAATHGLAASGNAGSALFGSSWGVDPRWIVLYCGIDIAPFRQRVDRAEVRRSLGVPSDALVLVHVGRFAPVKNHPFLLAVLGAAVRIDPRAHLLLVGDGPVRRNIEQSIDALGLASHCTLTGLRDDVPRILCGAADAFLLPSHHEGLGLAAVEAQAAGLPTILADTVPLDVEVVPVLIHRLPLAAAPEAWARHALSHAARRPVGADALARVVASPFAIERSADALRSVYESTRLRSTPFALDSALAR